MNGGPPSSPCTARISPRREGLCSVGPSTSRKSPGCALIDMPPRTLASFNGSRPRHSAHHLPSRNSSAWCESSKDGIDDAAAEIAVEWGAAEQQAVEDRPDH